MGITGIWQWVLILAIVLILFARPGKISGIMGDFGKGLRNFKTGMKDEDAVEGDDVEVIESSAEEAKPVRKKATAKKASGKKKAQESSEEKGCEKENPGLIALFLDQHLIFTGIIGCSIWAGRN